MVPASIGPEEAGKDCGQRHDERGFAIRGNDAYEQPAGIRLGLERR
jgi:hypothetical protein